jgi:hypothetical protein
LSAILEGKARAADTAEKLGLAELCYLKKRYLSAARFFAAAFAEQPKLAERLDGVHGVNAACCAALAAAGQGEEAARLGEKERSAMRRDALNRLRTDLALLGKQLESAAPQARDAVLKRLEMWMRDEDLRGVRDPVALANLLDAERAEWQKLWANLETTRKKAAEAGSK